MKTIKLLLSISVVLLLGACGGSSSSGNGGGNNQFAGTYSGNHTVTFSGGGSSSTDTIFLTMTVSGDGSFRIVDGDGGAGSVPAAGRLNGNKFNATGTGSDTIDGITCNLRITYLGTMTNNAANGNDRGSGTCSFQGSTITLNISGQFNLPKRGNARAPRGGTIISKAAVLLQ